MFGRIVQYHRNHYLLYVTYFINVTHAYASKTPLQNLLAQISIWDHRGQKVFFKKRGDLVHPPNLTRALGKGRMSSLPFLFKLGGDSYWDLDVSSFFLTMIASSSHAYWMFTKLGRSMCGCMATKLWVYSPGIWGQGSKTLTMHLQFKILLCHLVDNNQRKKSMVPCHMTPS